MDPLIHYGLRAFLALVVGASLLHHVRDLSRFRNAVAGYDLLPAPLVPVAVVLMLIVFAAMVPLLLGAGWIAGTAAMAGYAAFAFFAGFGLMIAFNLWRGHVEMDCGCSWMASERISPFLVVRNAVLAAAALAIVVEPSGRALIWVDHINILFFAFGGLALVMVADLLIHLNTYRESYL